MDQYYNAVTDPLLSYAPFSYCMCSVLEWHICLKILSIHAVQRMGLANFL